MTTEIVWFLDVDGVLNPDADSSAQVERTEAHLLGWPVEVAYRPEVVQRIQRVAGRVRLVWVTTWREEAVSAFGPAIGLTAAREVAPDPSDGRAYASRPSIDPAHNMWWKLGAVLAWLNENPTAAVIWADDDITREVAEQLGSAYVGRTLLLVPDGHHGLTTSDMDRVEQFVAEAKVLGSG